MRTPGEDAELACGFLVTEGILNRRDELVDVLPCRDEADPRRCNVVDVRAKEGVRLAERGWQRGFVAASGCGLCGKRTIESIHRHAPPVADDPLRVRPAVLYGLGERLRAAQRLFDETGGLHAAGLFDAAGRLRAVREDVGRHNAVDKLVGAAFLAGELPLAETILMVSGRASFEIVQKALVARIPMIVAVSAPSSLAVALAAASGMTLVGFLRDRTMNVYAGRSRIEP